MVHFSKHIIAFVLLAFAIPAPAQIVQSFCSGPTALQNQYLEDAWYLAYRFQMQTDSVNMSKTLPVNPNIKDMTLAALLGVYNADLAARDTVTTQYNIHVHKQIDLKRFEIYVDTNHQWTKEFLKGNVKNTGNFYIDSLSKIYDFEIDFVNYLPAWVLDYNAVARVKTSKYVNTVFMAEIMLSQTGVKFANPFTFGGDGNQIFFERKDTVSMLTFRRGWEDCPSGCLYRRDWVFNIYDDCKVEFATSYGDHPASSETTVPTFADHLQLFPNPADDYFSISCHLPTGTTATLQLTTLSGVRVWVNTYQVQDGNLQEKIDLQSISNGAYLLTITADNQSITKKIIVLKPR